MADFQLTEAIDNDLITTINCEGNIINIENDNEGNMTLSDEEFIDDSFVEESVTDYYVFTNVSREYNDAIQDSFSDLDYDQEPNNYCADENELHDSKIDDFNDSKSKVEKFEKGLVNPQGFNNKDSFFYSILFAIRHWLTNKSDVVENDEQIKVDIGVEIFDEIYPLNEQG